MKAFFSALAHPFSTRQATPRRTFWHALLGFVLLFVLLYVLRAVMIDQAQRSIEEFGFAKANAWQPFFFGLDLLALYLIIALTSLTNRRLRDTGSSPLTLIGVACFGICAVISYFLSFYTAAATPLTAPDMPPWDLTRIGTLLCALLFCTGFLPPLLARLCSPTSGTPAEAGGFWGRAAAHFTRWRDYRGTSAPAEYRSGLFLYLGQLLLTSVPGAWACKKVFAVGITDPTFLPEGALTFFVGVPAAVALLLPLAAATVRRLRDAKLTPWYLLLPPVCVILCLIIPRRTGISPTSLSTS